MILKRFSKGSFLKNTLILMTGAGVAQAIPLLFSPVLTRIFSPVEFGKLAFFMAMSAILGIIATGLYEMAIMLPKKDVAAINILALVVALSLVVSIVIWMLVIAFGHQFINLIDSPVSFDYLLLVPVGVFFTGVFQGMLNWYNRKKQYRLINICKILQSSITVAVSIILGYFGYKSYGLIIGFMLGTIASTAPLFIIIIKRQLLISRPAMWQVAKEYSNYPRVMMATTIMNTSASQSPIFFINKFYQERIVGSFSFATRMLTAPVGIISQAIGQVYYQKISELVHLRSGKIFSAFIKTAKTLALISVVLFLPLVFFGDEIFKLLFGNEWETAGKYVQVIAIAVAVKFVVSPLSTVFLSTNRLLTVAAWQALYLTTTVTLFLVFKHLEFEKLLWIYTIHECVLYGIYYALMIRVSKKFDSNVTGSIN